MAKNFIDYEKVERLSEGDSGVGIEKKVMKLFEEGGELSQAMLKYVKSPNVSASADVVDVRALVMEECMDVTNVILDIVNAMGFNDDECKEMFDKKLNKWEAKQKRY